MKKIAVLLVGASIALASCGGNAGMDEAAMQHKIDSTAKELAKSDIERLQKSCDDAVMQAAQDSAKAIMAAAKHETKKATTKKTTKHEEPVKETKTKVDPKKDKMSGNHNTNVEDKKSKMNGEETKTNVEAKKSKMNKMKATDNK